MSVLDWESPSVERKQGALEGQERKPGSCHLLLEVRRAERRWGRLAGTRPCKHLSTMARSLALSQEPSEAIKWC